MARIFVVFFVVTAVFLIGGCTEQPSRGQSDVHELTAAIQGLGPGVDTAEAERAAEIAYQYSLQLAQEYRITDSPVIHNAKVKNGFRERGLCNHFVEDILKRMDQESFRTLTLHWAASDPRTFQIPHYTAVISQSGDDIHDGIVLDPWRYGGHLYWSKTGLDETYTWAELE